MSTPARRARKEAGYQRDIKPAVQEDAALMRRPATPVHQGARLRGARRQHLQALAVAIQAMLKGTHIESISGSSRSRTGSRRSAGGNFDLGISAIVSTLMDRRLFHRVVRQGRPAELLVWTNPAFHDLRIRSIASSMTTGAKRWSTRARNPRAGSAADSGRLRADLRRRYNKVQAENPSTYFGIYESWLWDQVGSHEGRGRACGVPGAPGSVRRRNAASASRSVSS